MLAVYDQTVSKITNLVEDNTEEEENNVEDLVDNHLSK